MAEALRLDMDASAAWEIRSNTATGEPMAKSALSPYAEFKKRTNIGTGAMKCNTFVEQVMTIEAGQNQDIDLTSIVKSNLQVTFTSIKRLRILNLSETSGDYLRIGKYGSPTGAWDGPFGSTAGAYQEVYRGGCYLQDRYLDTGWVVDSSHYVLRINNPGLNDIQAHVLIAGEG